MSSAAKRFNEKRQRQLEAAIDRELDTGGLTALYSFLGLNGFTCILDLTAPFPAFSSISLQAGIASISTPRWQMILKMLQWAVSLAMYFMMT